MPAIIDLDRGQVVFRCMGDAECIREKNTLLHDHPNTRYKIVGMETGSYDDWDDPADSLDDDYTPH